MYDQPLPYHVAQFYPNMVPIRRQLSPKEILWRIAWPSVFTLVLASLMLLFILILFSLEIASLAIDSSNNLSNTASTGAGIWCSIFIMIPVIFMYLLVLVYDSSRIWSTYTLIANFIALIFICVVIGLDANAITPYNIMSTTAPIKIKILQGQLAVAILMVLFPFGFLAVYIYTAFKSLFPLRPHTHSVYAPFPVPSTFDKY